MKEGKQIPGEPFRIEKKEEAGTQDTQSYAYSLPVKLE